MSVGPEEIALALGRTTSLSATESSQWSMWINDALMLIEDRLGNVGDLNQAKLNYVVREAVVTHVRNPDNATTVQVSVDDASSARTYKTSRGRVHILDEWWALLAPVSDKSGAFVVDMLGVGTVHLPWCALMFNAAYCSCGVDIAGEPIFELG